MSVTDDMRPNLLLMLKSAENSLGLLQLSLERLQHDQTRVMAEVQRLEGLAGCLRGAIANTIDPREPSAQAGIWNDGICIDPAVE